MAQSEWRRVATEQVIESVVKGFEYDPGHSDLDNEQPIHVRMTLGDYRKAVGIIREKAWDERVLK